MQYITRILSIVALLGLLSPAFAGEPVESNAKSSKDAFLSFVLTKAEKYSGSMEVAVSKAMDEAPIVAKEFLVWRTWEHGMFLAISWALAFVLVVTGIILAKEESKDTRLGSLALFFCVVIIPFGIGVEQLFYLIQIQVAPRIYIIEEISKMIK